MRGVPCRTRDIPGRADQIIRQKPGVDDTEERAGFAASGTEHDASSERKKRYYYIDNIIINIEILTIII